MQMVYNRFPLADANQLEQQTKALQTAYESAQEELKSLEQEQQTQKIRQQTLQQEINEQQRLIDTAGHEQQKCLSNYGGQKEQLYQSLQQAETEKNKRLIYWPSSKNGCCHMPTV